ncbi:Txe/YoeB family addiction module toxin [Curtobacterium sp. SP.BCp]|uniref:Txe/YoeB family addiction module toxin n=1 Tax=Curtobacterium sp. SP.BCp TaxID=3435230 RepID=UPI003F740BED
MSERRLTWTAEGWDDYVYWQTQDRKTLRRINSLIDDVLRDDPFAGIGKPEPLKHVLDGAWSRRIDDTNRLVYLVSDDAIIVLQARYHY